eukprot:EG_transcript_70485
MGVNLQHLLHWATRDVLRVSTADEACHGQLCPIDVATHHRPDAPAFLKKILASASFVHCDSSALAVNILDVEYQRSAAQTNETGGQFLQTAADMAVQARN